MAKKVIDSSALLAFLEDGPGAEEIQRLFERAEKSRAGQQLLMSAVSWGELYEAVLQSAGKDVAESVAVQVGQLPIDIVGVGDDPTAMKLAARYRADGALDVADSYAAALAKTKRADLFTARKSLQALQGELKIKALSD